MRSKVVQSAIDSLARHHRYLNTGEGFPLHPARIAECKKIVGKAASEAMSQSEWDRLNMWHNFAKTQLLCCPLEDT